MTHHITCRGGFSGAERERERLHGLGEESRWILDVSADSRSQKQLHCSASLSLHRRWMRRATVGHALQDLIKTAQHAQGCDLLHWRKYCTCCMCLDWFRSARMLISHAVLCFAWEIRLISLRIRTVCFKFWACLKQVLSAYRWFLIIEEG